MNYQKLEEADQVDILINFLNSRDNLNLKAIGVAEPPDFLLNDNSGLEVTRVLDENLTKTNFSNYQFITEFRKALFSANLQKSYKIDIFVEDRKIFFSRNKSNQIIQFIIEYLRKSSSITNSFGIENIFVEPLTSNSNSEIYNISLLEKNPDKTSRITAFSINGYYYVDKPERLSDDIKNIINKKVKKYNKENIKIEKLLTYFPNEGNHFIKNTNIFIEACKLARFSWNNVFSDVYCISNTQYFDDRVTALKHDEYCIFDFSKDESYIWDNGNKRINEIFES